MRALRWVFVIVLGSACGTGDGVPRSAASDAKVDSERGAKPEVKTSPEAGDDSERRAESSPAGVASGGPSDGKGSAEDGLGSSTASQQSTLDGTPPVVHDAQDVELLAGDGTTVYGRFHPTGEREAGPIALLFHQAASNAAEYEPIAPRLQTLGWDALAIDQRSGKRRFGRDNLTVKALGKSTGFGKAYRDLEAALAWAKERGHSPVIVWGSSYTAALVFRLAAEHDGEIDAVLAFSPGEYMGGKGTVAGWAKQVSVPVFVTSAPKEAEEAGGIAKAVGDTAEQLVPKRGVHGASILREDRNAVGHEEVWTAVEGFLGRVGR